MEKYKKNSAAQHCIMLPQHFQNKFKNSTPEKYYPISSGISSSSINTGYNSSSSPGYTSSMLDDSLLPQSKIETQRFLEKRPDNLNQIRKTSFQPPVHQRPRFISETGSTGTNATYLSNSSINQVGRSQLQFASHNKRKSDLPIYNSERVVCDDRFDDPSYGQRSFSLLRNVYTERKSSIQLTFLLILVGVLTAVGIIYLLTVIGVEADRKLPPDFNINITSVNDERVFKMGHHDTASRGILGLDLGLLGSDSTPPYQNQLPTAVPMNSIQTRNNPRKVPREVPTPPVTATENYRNPRTSTKFLAEIAKPRNIKPMSRFLADDDISNNNNRKPINYTQIKSAADFKKLEFTTVEAIIIKQLVDAPVSNGTHAHVDLSRRHSDQIKHLKISGPITEEWLSCILKKFDKVENLTINVDELCIGAAVRDRESLEPLKLESVQSLHIENLHYCTISSWIFKWELPNLHKLKIHNSDLTKKRFEPLHGFLERRKKVLNSVVISKSYICPECSFADVQYTNRKMIIQILDQLQNPFMSS